MGPHLLAVAADERAALWQKQHAAPLLRGLLRVRSSAWQLRELDCACIPGAPVAWTKASADPPSRSTPQQALCTSRSSYRCLMWLSSGQQQQAAPPGSGWQGRPLLCSAAVLCSRPLAHRKLQASGVRGETCRPGTQCCRRRGEGPAYMASKRPWRAPNLTCAHTLLACPHRASKRHWKRADACLLSSAVRAGQGVRGWASQPGGRSPLQYARADCLPNSCTQAQASAQPPSERCTKTAAIVPGAPANLLATAFAAMREIVHIQAGQCGNQCALLFEDILSPHSALSWAACPWSSCIFLCSLKPPGAAPLLLGTYYSC